MAEENAAARLRLHHGCAGPYAWPARSRTHPDASVTTAEAAREVVAERAAKMLLRAPCSGVVALLASEPGEAVVPGEPVVTMVPDNGVWFGLNLREDMLRGLTIGSVVPLRAADAAKPMSAKVVEMRSWGEFAVWRAARATGDHDLNTFFVRLDPVPTVPKLSPGQTIWLDLPVTARK